MSDLNLSGNHYIAGTWVEGSRTFSSEPAHGPSRAFAVGDPAHVDTAVEAAENACKTQAAAKSDLRIRCF